MSKHRFAKQVCKADKSRKNSMISIAMSKASQSPSVSIDASNDFNDDKENQKEMKAAVQLKAKSSLRSQKSKVSS